VIENTKKVAGGWSLLDKEELYITFTILQISLA
jgi:hypothetical protein